MADQPAVLTGDPREPSEPAMRHVEVDTGDPLVPAYCAFCHQPWPCGAQRERDAADGA